MSGKEGKHQDTKTQRHTEQEASLLAIDECRIKVKTNFKSRTSKPKKLLTRETYFFYE